jgi:TolA-binding protein
MSIITQALKKAQHEQRLQQTPQAQYSSLAPWRPKVPRRRWSKRSSRRFSGLMVAGIALLGGVGIVTYIGQSARAPFPVAMTVPDMPQPAPESELPWPQLTPTPSPQALKEVPSKSLQPASPRLRMDLETSVTPPMPLAQLSPPTAQPDAPLTSEQTPTVEPEISRAERRDLAQQQFNNGIEAYNAGAFDEAEAALQQAIDLDPTFKQAVNRLGNLYYQREAYQQALAMYQQALVLDPDYIEARNNLGSTYMRLDMSARAISELNKAMAVDGESGLTYYNMACVYARTGESAKAIRYLEMAIAHEPEARHWAKTDTDFKTIRPTSAFQKLLGMSS